jgi:hypothetical protein
LDVDAQPLPEHLGAVVVRTYPGRSQEDAVEAFQADMPALVGRGYRVVSQSWDAGRRGAAGAVTLGVLSPKQGTLSVTYELAEVAPASAASAATARGGSLGRLQELDNLRAAGAITDEEYAAKRAEIIEEI